MSGGKNSKKNPKIIYHYLVTKVTISESDEIKKKKLFSIIGYFIEFFDQPIPANRS